MNITSASALLFMRENLNNDDELSLCRYSNFPRAFHGEIIMRKNHCCRKYAVADTKLNYYLLNTLIIDNKHPTWKTFFLNLLGSEYKKDLKNYIKILLPSSDSRLGSIFSSLFDLMISTKKQKSKKKRRNKELWWLLSGSVLILFLFFPIILTFCDLRML